MSRYATFRAGHYGSLGFDSLEAPSPSSCLSPPFGVPSRPLPCGFGTVPSMRFSTSSRRLSSRGSDMIAGLAIPFTPLSRGDEVPLAVGHATIAWNNVSLSVFRLYQTLSGQERAAAAATFFVVASDRSQRDMVAALIKLKLEPIDAKLAQRALTQIGKINSIAGKRNDIQHVIFVDSHDPSQVRPFHERGHLKGKAGENLVVSIYELAISCLECSGELSKLEFEIANLPKFRGRFLAEAILQSIHQSTPEEVASRGEYGLLDDLGKTEASPSEDRP